jgi:hypothetical protein
MTEEPEKVSSSVLHQPSGDKKPEDVGIKPQVCDLLNFSPFAGSIQGFANFISGCLN